MVATKKRLAEQLRKEIEAEYDRDLEAVRKRLVKKRDEKLKALAFSSDVEFSKSGDGPTIEKNHKKRSKRADIETTHDDLSRNERIREAIPKQDIEFYSKNIIDYVSKYFPDVKSTSVSAELGRMAKKKNPIIRALRKEGKAVVYGKT